MSKFDAPIPGENFTSDTKNYPWHRPPEHTDLDKAIEAIADRLLDEDSAIGILTMLESGVTIVQLTDMFLTSGIGAGKWTMDFALLLAGPTSHILYLMAKSYGIDCDLGIEDTVKPLTRAFFEGFEKIDEKKTMDAIKQVDMELVKQTAGTESKGLMSMVKKKEAY